MTSGIALIVVAIAAITVSRSFDGFVQGLLSGAGIMLALIGTPSSPPCCAIGTSDPPVRPTPRVSRRPTSRPAGEEESDPAWLPSRDSRP